MWGRKERRKERGDVVNGEDGERGEGEDVERGEGEKGRGHTREETVVKKEERNEGQLTTQ